MQTLRRIDSLDGLRFIAAVAVMIAHLGLWQVLLHGPLEFDHMAPFTWFVLHLANFGMTLFFVLSGFVIHMNYRDVVRRKGGTSRFFLARWSRLYPLFLVVFVGGWLHLAIVNGITRALVEPVPLYVGFIDTWWFWPIQGVAAASAYQEPALGVMWSLATEMFFYCSYPFIALAISRLRPRQSLGGMALVGIAAICVGSFVILRSGVVLTAAEAMIGNVDGGRFIHWLAFNSPWLRIFEFLSGCLAAQFCASLRLRPMHADALAATALTIVTGMFIAMFVTHSPLGALDTTLVAPCFAALCMAAAAPRSVVSRLFSHRAMVWGGEASYSLYLLHSSVLVTLSMPSVGLYRSDAPALWAAASAIIAIRLSRVCYVFYERPAPRFFRRPGEQWLDRRLVAQSATNLSS